MNFTAYIKSFFKYLFIAALSAVFLLLWNDSISTSASQPHTSARTNVDATKMQLAKCMKDAEYHYNNSVERLCNGAKINCKAMVGTYSPKLLEPLINTLNKEQDICIKLAGL